MYSYDRTAAAEPMTAEDFVKEFEKHLNIGDRQVKTGISTLGGPNRPSVHIRFVNLPKGVGGAGGGAEAENNRMSFMTHFPTSPADKIKVEQIVSAMDRKYRMRAKSGHPAKVAKYLADYINRIAKEVEPKFTHTGR
jgi:hypothetical protein